MNIILKPTYACNLRCRYCYLNNDTKAHIERFDVDFAQKFVLQLKELYKDCPHRKINFIWHGGEPLLWGIDNYRTIFSFMQKELVGYNYRNSIQTNLTLINDSYIDLFVEYNVHVGFSLDGPQEIHDCQRVDINGNGSFDTIMDNLQLCRKKGLSLGCIVVGTKKHIGNIPKLYEFMANNNLSFKFNPIFNSGEAKNNDDEYGITIDEYADMAIELFDLWYNDKQHHIVESNFVEIASNLATGKPGGCLFGKNCQDNFFAISPVGDVVPCGRFCDTDSRQYAYGNLYKESLSEILPRIKTSQIYQRASYIEKSDCGKCRFFPICHGGCLHDGFLTSGDFKSKSFLCSAYKRIFAHIMDSMSDLVKHREGKGVNGMLSKEVSSKD